MAATPEYGHLPPEQPIKMCKEAPDIYRPGNRFGSVVH